MCSLLIDALKIVTYGHGCHMKSKLSHLVKIVPCGHNCHMWSQLSHMVTIVTCIVIAAIQISISPHPPLPSDMLTLRLLRRRR